MIGRPAVSLRNILYHFLLLFRSSCHNLLIGVALLLFVWQFYYGNLYLQPNVGTCNSDGIMQIFTYVIDVIAPNMMKYNKIYFRNKNPYKYFSCIIYNFLLFKKTKDDNKLTNWSPYRIALPRGTTNENTQTTAIPIKINLAKFPEAPIIMVVCTVCTY